MLPLIGTVPAPISSAPLVILIYVVLILLVASALASVLLQDTRYILGAFVAAMLLVALLYLTVAPALLFAVQLLVFTVISALLVVGTLRNTAGLDAEAVGPFSREWIAGGAAAAVLLALLVVVLAATNWPAEPCCRYIQVPGAVADFGSSLTSGYVVALATAVVLLASAALGAGLILRGIPLLSTPRGRAERGPSRPGARRIPRTPPR